MTDRLTTSSEQVSIEDIGMRAIDSVLDMDFNDKRGGFNFGTIKRGALFRSLAVLTSDWLDASPDSDEARIFSGAGPEVLDSPLGVGVIRDDPDTGLMSVNYARRVSAKSVRSRCRIFLPYMVEVGQLYQGCSGAVHYVYGWSEKRKEWVWCEHEIISDNKGTAIQGVEDHEENQACIHMLTGLQLTRRYEWLVALGDSERGVGVCFETDPEGARVFFKDREKPEGKNRRSALRHWVRSHWRKKRKGNPEDLAWVKKHLHSHQDFKWRGFDCRLIVPPYEVFRAKLENEAKLISVREARSEKFDIEELMLPVPGETNETLKNLYSSVVSKMMKEDEGE